jgi:hypothetical protein
MDAIWPITLNVPPLTPPGAVHEQFDDFLRQRCLGGSFLVHVAAKRSRDDIQSFTFTPRYLWYSMMQNLGIVGISFHMFYDIHINFISICFLLFPLLNISFQQQICVSPGSHFQCPPCCASRVENSPWASRNSREWHTSNGYSDRAP